MGFFDSPDTVSTTTPWGPQQKPLQNGYNEAGRLYQMYRGTPGYQGEMVAGQNPFQSEALSSLFGNGQGAGQDYGNSLIDAGNQTINNLGNYANNAQGLFDGQSQEAQQQGTLRGAAAYADSPYLQSQIDAAGRDINQITGKRISNAEISASGSGNLNSSRSGALEASLVNEGRDRMAGLSADLRGNAYSQGLNLANQQGQQTFGNQVAANQQIGNSATTGVDFATQGIAGLYGGNQAALLAGNQLQEQDQRVLDSNYQLFNENDQRPWDLLKQYQGIINGSHGSVSRTSGGGPGTVAGIAGLASTAAGIYGSLS